MSSPSIALNPSRGFVGNTINYLKQNAPSCVGTLAVAAPLIIGGIFLNRGYYNSFMHSNNVLDKSTYSKMVINSFVLTAAVTFNTLTNLACNIIENTKAFYNQMKQNYTSSPNRYISCIQAIKNTCITTTISLITGLVAQNLNHIFFRDNIIPSIPIAVITSIIANVIITRNPKKA